MSVQFTVAIPTYNGANRFPEVLDKLRQQTGVESLSWEIILVDNNSTDSTAQVFQEYQKTWDLNIPLRYEFEPEQGAAFARQRAVKKSESELIGFLDDDNLPSDNWVYSALKFAQEYPQAGAFGSQIHGQFESPPSEEVKPLLRFLAIVERGDQPLEYSPKNNLLPPSAGLVVRKQAWLTSVPENLILTGRVEGSWLTSEDLETLSYLRKNGWEIWYNPQMEIDHKIPDSRLQRSYLLSLLQGIGLSRYVTRTINFKPWQRPLIYPMYMVNDIRRMILLFLRYRTQVKSNLTAACRLEMLVNSLKSPFYLWKNKYLDKV
ncbi:hormogonium polysaccharide biosynthesis glycosyltransferase HpsE [Roseofilum capinflatum]|uniref:Hormogonium polysaccharide biosynthesis glycosyltransferase HpsE n=1 Tax=Roseofilum capinflatum BLCC-M114 TaxID=3022440 RepID=A0ABT7B856_9CYAN|nr:hormogonium polysaccharide biosynthesis glycosyltransferase HpsE [Roseofilum capinflatum]MDJ1174982.1 hormogonium polysaccharide biosynthesis glycosyltransferase HpsE [Roseofilum capinflatum BLCC-M114]